jgi:hypothetical protein
VIKYLRSIEDPGKTYMTKLIPDIMDILLRLNAKETVALGRAVSLYRKIHKNDPTAHETLLHLSEISKKVTRLLVIQEETTPSNE